MTLDQWQTDVALPALKSAGYTDVTFSGYTHVCQNRLLPCFSFIRLVRAKKYGLSHTGFVAGGSGYECVIATNIVTGGNEHSHLEAQMSGKIDWNKPLAYVGVNGNDYNYYPIDVLTTTARGSAPVVVNAGNYIISCKLDGTSAYSEQQVFINRASYASRLALAVAELMAAFKASI